MTGSVPARELSNRAVAANLAEGQDVLPTEYESLRSAVIAYVRSAVQLPSSADYEDAVDAAFEKFLTASSGGRIRPTTALSYLRRIARNTAIDETRRSRKLVPEVANAARSDDEIVRLIHDRATTEVIEALLRECVAERNQLATRVINAFLNLAEELDATPSSRLVAQKAKVSHTTVQNTLARLRERLDPDWLP